MRITIEPESNPAPDGILADTAGMQRARLVTANLEELVDTDTHHGISYRYLRITPPLSVELVLPPRYTVNAQRQHSTFGRLFHCYCDGSRFVLWFPVDAAVTEFHDGGRISPLRPIPPTPSRAGDTTALITYADPPDSGTLYLSYVVLKDESGETFRAIADLLASEMRHFRKSSWFRCDRPSDFWSYLIFGDVVDPRTFPGVGLQFKCQQCAFAWWTYFGFLHQEFGYALYRSLQRLIAASVLWDWQCHQSWQHGFWRHEMETHSRFFLDGINLLLSEFETDAHPDFLRAAEEAGLTFLRDLSEELEGGGIWFLHDSIESEQSHHLRSRLFGKTEDNAFCLNTHIQAITVFQRLSRHSSHSQFPACTRAAAQTLRALLELRPADWLYRPLAKRIGAFMLRTLILSSSQSATRQFLHRVERKILSTLYWNAQRWFPRVVFPNGMIARTLTTNLAPGFYQLINLKDLLVLYIMDHSQDWIRPIAREGLRFCQEHIGRLGYETFLRDSPYYHEYVDLLQMAQELRIADVSEELRNCLAAMTMRDELSLDFHTSPFRVVPARTPVPMAGKPPDACPQEGRHSRR